MPDSVPVPTPDTAAHCLRCGRMAPKAPMMTLPGGWPLWLCDRCLMEARRGR